MIGKTARLCFILFMLSIIALIIAYALIMIFPALAIMFSLGILVCYWIAGITILLFILFMVVPGLRGR